MRTANNDLDLSPWLWGLVHHRPVKPGGFLEQLASTVFNADMHNYELLRPALIAIRNKYPKYHWVPSKGWTTER